MLREWALKWCWYSISVTEMTADMHKATLEAAGCSIGHQLMNKGERQFVGRKLLKLENGFFLPNIRMKISILIDMATIQIIKKYQRNPINKKL